MKVPALSYSRSDGRRPREWDSRPYMRAYMAQYRAVYPDKVRASKRAYNRTERGQDVRLVGQRAKAGWSVYAARNTPIGHGPRKGHIPNV